MSSVQSVKIQPKIDKLLTVATSSSHEDKVKSAELLIAAFIAEHNITFNAASHLSKLIPKICSYSVIAIGITCSHTKCTALVKNVIGRKSFEDLCEKLKVNKFSILVDEASDSVGIKQFCIVVRTVDDNFKVHEKFFSLTDLGSATSEVLFDMVIQSFQEAGIELKDNLVGMAGDGANVIMGGNNSLSSRPKEMIHGIFIMKCICHSFHLCASKACQKLPDFVEQLTRDIYNYFHCSSKRFAALREFQEFVGTEPHKLLHPAQTRWLSLLPVVKRILEQYQALILFFQDVALSEQIPAAQNILTLLRNPICKLYLQFLEFILSQFEDLNKKMHSEKP
ncbi:general transcription factor II-I repeat domain-containing protein 2A-like [Bacillus rossius redtenbacheri]|uniref:general transcription factor II-I repeat domain-containing protein 2A-like n=1 Tax=Bacillus rossius redtenbacheri TaxID=93214 RepID=UPI002FDEDDD9